MLYTLLPLISRCTSSDVQHSAENDSHHQEPEPENELVTSLTSAQMATIGIELGKFEKKQLTASLKANGILKVPNQNRAKVTPQMGGVIKQILVQTGNEIKKGQTIATITNIAFIIMQEEYLSTVAKLRLAEAEFVRQKTLLDGNAASQKALQQAREVLDLLQVKKSSLSNQLAMIGIRAAAISADNLQSVVNIKSPINGSVSELMVNIGSFVDANNPVAEIVDNSQLHLDLYVYEKDLGKLKSGQTIHFTLTNNPGNEYDADVYAISNTFEPNTKAIAVHALVKGNKQGLIDGMSITALVSLENATVNAVPTDAIVSSDGKDYIFVVIDNLLKESAHHFDHKEDSGHDHVANRQQTMEFERIPVVKGTTDVGYSEVTLLKDIPENSQVVTKGAFFILSKLINTGGARTLKRSYGLIRSKI